MPRDCAVAGVNSLDGIRAAAEQCPNSVESALPSFAPVIALARGLEILRVINAERQSTVGSVHKATGLDKATIVRMLETLEHEGYVMRCEEPTVYVPTGRSLLLSQGYDKYLWIGRVAEPLLNEFRKQIQWPSDIAVFDDDAMIVAHTTREAGSLLFSRRPGFRFPARRTSIGRVYSAFVNDAEARPDRFPAGGQPGAMERPCANRRRLTRSWPISARPGYAVMDDDYSRQVFLRYRLGFRRTRDDRPGGVRQHERHDAAQGRVAGGRSVSSLRPCSSRPRKIAER